jgi:DNA replication initiation complex subunit (GINS family)
MNGDEIGFSEISDVHRNERRGKVLTKLPVNFYSRAEEHLQKLKEEYGQAILIPNNPSTMMLQDQIKKLDKRLKHIYEIRERKIAIAALDRMGGAMPPDNMTKKDRSLYDQLVETLKCFRSGSEPLPVPKCPEPKKRVEEMPVEEVKVVSQPKIVEPEPEIGTPGSGPGESMIVHVLEDIPPFAGPSHTYDLRKDDLVSLPSQFADLLSSKGMVRIVQG